MTEPKHEWTEDAMTRDYRCRRCGIRIASDDVRLFRGQFLVPRGLDQCVQGYSDAEWMPAYAARLTR